MEVYQRTDCVIYDAIVQSAQEMVASGLRPWKVSVSAEGFALLTEMGKVVTFKISGGRTKWLSMPDGGNVRVYVDERLGGGQFKLEGIQRYDQQGEVGGVPSPSPRQLDEVSF